MSWIELEYSKKAVRRAGDCLLSLESDFEDFLKAYNVMDNWRSSHSYPIQSMLGYFRKKAKSIDNDSIVVQRLKREPSILSKLRRENGMKLDRMEDIGGCRIIVSNKYQVYEVKNAIVDGKTRNTLRRQRDYIKEPKESGYRGIHLIYRYNGRKTKFCKHSVELQIRSKVQHSWATAVEVVGTFTGQSLKASEGEDEWLKFFNLASIAFSDIENKNLAKNYNTDERIELLKYIDKLKVIPKLRAFAVSTKHLSSLKRSSVTLYLLTLKIDESNIQIMRYSSEHYEKANEQYAALEKEYKDNKNRDVVLVSAESIHGLKKAYPNYFADTSAFTKNIERIVETNSKYS